MELIILLNNCSKKKKLLNKIDLTNLIKIQLQNTKIEITKLHNVMCFSPMDSMSTPPAMLGIARNPCSNHRSPYFSVSKHNPSSDRLIGARHYTGPTSYLLWWRRTQGMGPPIGKHPHWSRCRRTQMVLSSSQSSPAHLWWPNCLRSICWRTSTLASRWGRSCLLPHCSCTPLWELCPQKTYMQNRCMYT